MHTAITLGITQLGAVVLPGVDFAMVVKKLTHPIAYSWRCNCIRNMYRIMHSLNLCIFGFSNIAPRLSLIF